jgi:hypothetical protein
MIIIVSEAAITILQHFFLTGSKNRCHGSPRRNYYILQIIVKINMFYLRTSICIHNFIAVLKMMISVLALPILFRTPSIQIPNDNYLVYDNDTQITL